MIEVIEQGRLSSRKKVATLGCFDWSRFNGYWDESSEAIDCVASWLVGRSTYTLLRTNLCNAPERDDFPGWRHNGNHVEMGKRYWNWFHARYHGTLHFADQPDFGGTFILPNQEKRR